MRHLVFELLPLAKLYCTCTKKTNNTQMKRDALKKLINIYIEISRLAFEIVRGHEESIATGIHGSVASEDEDDSIQ